MKPIHPACALCPKMSETDLVALASSIRENGLREPIMLLKGEILDGRNREIACGMAGVAPQYVEFDGDDPIEFVIDKNIKRRHWTLQELASIGSELAKLPRGGDRRSKDFKLTTASLNSVERIAQQLGISSASIYDAGAIKKYGTDNVIEMAGTGKVGMRDAATFARHTPKAEQEKATIANIKGAEVRLRKTKNKKPAANDAEQFITKLTQLMKRVKTQARCIAPTVSFAELHMIAGEMKLLIDQLTSSDGKLAYRTANFVVHPMSGNEGRDDDESSLSADRQRNSGTHS